MDDSVIMCDIVIELYDEVPDVDVENKETKAYDETNFNKKKATCKSENFYALLYFYVLLIAKTLLIVVNIYCYLIKY